MLLNFSKLRPESGAWGGLEPHFSQYIPVDEGNLCDRPVRSACAVDGEKSLDRARETARQLLLIGALL